MHLLHIPNVFLTDRQREGFFPAIALRHVLFTPALSGIALKTQDLIRLIIPNKYKRILIVIQ